MTPGIPVLGELSTAEREAMQVLRVPLLTALANVITPFGSYLRERLAATCPLSQQETEDARGACVRHFDQMVRGLLSDKGTATASAMPWPCAVSHTLFVEVTWRYLDLITRAIEATPGALDRRETPIVLHALGRLLFSGLALNLRREEVQGEGREGGRGKGVEVLNTRDAFLLGQTVVGVCLLAPEGGVLQGNARIAQMLGREEADLRRASFHELILEQDVWRYLQGSRALLAGDEDEVVCTLRLRHAGGRAVAVLLGLYLVRRDDGVPAHFVAIAAQTDDGQGESAASGHEHGVSHDRLTGLPDRLLVRDRIEQAIAQASQNPEEQVAVLLIDLDRFKNVNASLGHDAGDEVLKQTANRLRRTLPPEHTVARLGNDEFIVVMPDLKGLDNITRTADTVLKKLAIPFSVSGEDIFLSASIGIAVYPKDGENAQGLLRNADSALYFIKSLYGGDSFHYYTEEMNANARRDLQIEQGLHKALERGELHLHFQPQVDTNDRRMIGVEALVRWKAEGGQIPPGQFIPVAEKSGLVVQIGDWVLREACRQAAHWRAMGMPPVVVAVNVSPVQMRREGFVEHVSEVLKETGLPPDELELEITEGVLVDNPDEVRRILDQLHALGVHVSIDDFGTGYSSLAYLKEFPVNMVKIDRSFVTHIVENPQDAAVVSAVMALSKGMGFNVIAEGVETEAQLDYLRSLGLQRCQGYLTGRPMPPEQIPDFVRGIN